MNIKLLFDKVLVSVPEEARTSSGLILSNESDVSSFKTGVVKAIGPGENKNGEIRVLFVKPGDEVIFSFGDTITLEGKKYWMVKESDIAMIINIDRGAQK